MPRAQQTRRGRIEECDITQYTTHLQLFKAALTELTDKRMRAKDPVHGDAAFAAFVRIYNLYDAIAMKKRLSNAHRTAFTALFQQMRDSIINEYKVTLYLIVFGSIANNSNMRSVEQNDHKSSDFVDFLFTQFPYTPRESMSVIPWIFSQFYTAQKTPPHKKIAIIEYLCAHYPFRVTAEIIGSDGIIVPEPLTLVKNSPGSDAAALERILLALVKMIDFQGIYPCEFNLVVRHIIANNFLQPNNAIFHYLANNTAFIQRYTKEYGITTQSTVMEHFYSRCQTTESTDPAYIQSLQQSIVDNEKQIAAYTAELASYAQQNQDRDNDPVHQQLHNLTLEYEAKKRERNELNTKLTAARQKLQTKQDSLEEQVAALQARLAALQEHNRQLQARVDTDTPPHPRLEAAMQEQARLQRQADDSFNTLIRAKLKLRDREYARSIRADKHRLTRQNIVEKLELEIKETKQKINALKTTDSNNDRDTEQLLNQLYADYQFLTTRLKELTIPQADDLSQANCELNRISTRRLSI